MNNKEILQEIFNKNGIVWDIKEFNDYIDPKCKTAKSIYDKLIRLYSKEKPKENYSINDSGIDDLLRMTIISEYSEVPSIIDKLQKKFPDLSGYITIEAAGYRGVHLNLKIDGLPCEIQIAPQLVVMGVDYLHTLYEKWRNFDNTKIKDKNILEEERKDFDLRKKTYDELFEITKFEQYQAEISQVIEIINTSKKESLPLTNQHIIELLNRDLLTNQEIDKEKVILVAEELSKSITSTQEKFVTTVKQTIGERYEK